MEYPCKLYILMKFINCCKQQAILRSQRDKNEIFTLKHLFIFINSRQEERSVKYKMKLPAYESLSRILLKNFHTLWELLNKILNRVKGNAPN